MLLGEKIKYCRKRNGLNQADFANILNISLEEVQKWESNTVIPELDKLIEISNILDVSLDFLLKESQKEEKSNLNTKSEKPHIGHAIAQHEKHLSENKIKAIKGWMIIGCVLTPLVTGASYINNQYKPESLLFLLMYIFTIPLCVMSIKKCREAKSKSDLIGFGIVSLLVISFIAGLLMITIRDEDFIDDTFKIQPKINAANNKILSAKLLAKNQKKKEKKLTISKKNKINVINSLFIQFKSQKYNPLDIVKARNEKNAVIKKITLTTSTEDLDKEIINYNEFLNSFTLDEDYYINKRKKIKKYFALLTPITCAIIIMQILTVYVFIPLGKYNYAMSLIEDGYYFKANTYLEGNKWGDSDKQIQLNTARFFFMKGIMSLELIFFIILV